MTPDELFAIDTLLSEDERAMRDVVRDIVDREVRPNIRGWFADGALPAGVTAKDMILAVCAKIGVGGATGAGGAITLDKNTIKRMLSITRRASEGLIADHKRKLDVVYPETPDGKFTRERALFDIKAPAAYAPKDPTQRKAGTVYSTPKGDMTWTGTGWVPVQGQ